MINKIVKSLLIVGIIVTSSCSDLDSVELQDLQEVGDLTSQEQVDANLSAANLALRSFQQTDFQYVLQQHPSDEMAGPTRGADWDDGGVWRALHLHSWNSSHPRIIDAFDQIMGGMFNGLVALNQGATGVQEAEAKFYMTFFMFNAIDLWGRIPFREVGSPLTEDPITLERGEGIDRAIEILEPVYQSLPATTDPTVVNRNVAAMLLAKMYLNRAVYKATDADGTPQAGPYTFDTSDMQRVVELTNEVIGAGYTLQSNYFDIFSPNNSNVGTEAIFVSENDNNQGGELRRLYLSTLHYNQRPSSWNGFVALTDLYNKFDDADPRKNSEIPELSANSGLTGGFQVGQQRDVDGNNLTFRDGITPLVFTPDFSLASSNEGRGIRVVKYQPDFTDVNRPANDFVIYRLADAYLMKAEAMARMGMDATPVMTELWTARGVSGTYTDASLDGILDERARELYWEGYRRQDQIRFGTFLNPVQERPNSSERFKIIFPLPAIQVSLNPNLQQNPGY